VAARRGVWLVFLLILIGAALSAGGLIVVALLGGAPPSVPSNATLRLHLQAPFVEVEPAGVFSQFLDRQLTLRETLTLIREAREDRRVKAVILTVQAPGALWGQLQEVRGALEDLRASGKPVTAFIESAGAAEYYVASAANRVVMMPGGQLDVTGLATYELFFRAALDKIGVVPDLLHIGDYKTAANTFTETGFTEAHREMSRSLNSDWFGHIVKTVAAARSLSEDQARQALTGGPYGSDEALDAGLVDELAYQDQLDDAEPIRGTERLTGETYGRAVSYRRASGSGGRIALLYAAGTIASGDSRFDGPGGLVIGSDTFSEWVRTVRVDPGIRAVVVRIDSPGGSAIASEAIWRELMLTREVKPLVVSMGDVAASGGYYIAAPAHAIVAEPGTLTGSIGVVTGKFVVDGTLDKLGIDIAAVSEGAYAEIYSPFKPFSPAERARVQAQMRATYDLFVSRVAEGRGRTAAEIDAVGQGRVWTGRQAREIGLVDELGGLSMAIGLARQRAKIDPERDVELVVYPQKRSFYQVLANPLGSAELAARRLQRSELRLIDSAAAWLRLFRRGEPLALMPNVFFTR
jgi:protease-4